jgi:hypothetical protein
MSGSVKRAGWGLCGMPETIEVVVVVVVVVVEEGKGRTS